MNNILDKDIEESFKPLKKNIFILDLPDDLIVKYFMVRKIDKSAYHFNMENNNKLYVTIGEYGFGDAEAIEWCQKFNDLNLDDITFSDLDECSKRINLEHYTKPRISKISFGGSNYEHESIKEFMITIKYNSCFNDKE